jgi:MFS family permease
MDCTLGMPVLSDIIPFVILKGKPAGFSICLHREERVMTTAEQVVTRTFIPPRAARVAVSAIFFANGALVANWFARVPDAKQALGLSEGALNIALLSMAIGALLSQPTAGWFIGKVGSRKVTMVMAVANCVAFILPGFAPSLPLLALALFVYGASNGGLDVAMNAQAALVERRYARPIMNSFHALWSVGGLTGAAIGGLAAAGGLGTGMHFVIAAAAGLTVMLVAMRGLIPDGPALHAGHEPAFALPSRALLPMGIVALCALICEGAIGDWGAIYLREGLGSAAGAAAVGYAVFALTMAGGRFAGDWLATRFGSGNVVRAGGGLVVAGIGLALVSTTPGVAIAGYGLVGAGVSCIFPLIMSAAARTPGVAPGVGIAAMATAGYTGFLLGPPLIGGMAELFTLRGALGVLAIFGLVIMLLGSRVQGEALAPVETAAN